jgi:hypothetical protein
MYFRESLCKLVQGVRRNSRSFTRFTITIDFGISAVHLENLLNNAGLNQLDSTQGTLSTFKKEDPCPKKRNFFTQKRNQI